MLHPFAVHPRRACAVFAAALAIALAGSTEAQNSRADRLLTDKPSPAWRNCRIATSPNPIPALSAVADSAQRCAPSRSVGSACDFVSNRGGTPVFRTGNSEICAPESQVSFSLEVPVLTGVQAPSPVRLRLFINEDGRVASIRVASSSGDSEIDRWVESTITGYQFAPVIVDGIPTATEHEQTVRVRRPNGPSGRSRTGG